MLAPCADPKRASSEELDFGSSWRTQGDGPRKVVWLQATGELAAFLESAYQGWQSTGGGGGARRSLKDHGASRCQLGLLCPGVVSVAGGFRPECPFRGAPRADRTPALVDGLQEAHTRGAAGASLRLCASSTRRRHPARVLPTLGLPRHRERHRLSLRTG